jgi:hypothetical protein
MPDRAMEFETGNEDVFNGDNDQAVHEKTRRLEFMVAYLLERNEQLRFQLTSNRAKENG